MPSIWRIQDRSTFDDLRRHGRRVRRGPLTLTWVPGPIGEPPRVGFAVSREVGNAVIRNGVRRRLRAVMTEVVAAPSGAYLFRASPAAASLSFDEMRAIVFTAIAVIAPLAEPDAPGEGRR